MYEENFEIELSPSQRKLLLDHKTEMKNSDIMSLISNAIKKGNKYILVLKEEQFENLCDDVSFLSDTYPNRKKFIDLENYLDDYWFDVDIDE